jgi:hypothetical protein
MLRDIMAIFPIPRTGLIVGEGCWDLLSFIALQLNPGLALLYFQEFSVFNYSVTAVKSDIPPFGQTAFLQERSTIDQ